MIVYLDMCCIKRPFDDQTQPRIALETTAVLAILRAGVEDKVRIVRASAHDLENSRNPDARRAGAVQSWLEQLNPIELTPLAVTQRAASIKSAFGLRTLDALHLAWAEALKAEFFVTVDDGILAKAARLEDMIKVRVVGPVAVLAEASL